MIENRRRRRKKSYCLNNGHQKKLPFEAPCEEKKEDLQVIVWKINLKKELLSNAIYAVHQDGVCQLKS